MVREIVWTKRALYRYNLIINFLQDEWGEKVTVNFVKRTYEILDLIAENPTIGSLEDSRKNIRGFLITKQNRLFYRITKHQVILLNFFDSRSGPKRKKYQ